MRDELKPDEGRRPDDSASDHRIPGSARTPQLVVRCATCWGPVGQFSGQDGNLIGIQCLLCGRTVEGEDFEREAESMRLEAHRNIPGACVGRGSNYREDARFVLKVVPDMDRDNARYDELVAEARKAKRRKNWLGRRDFAPGEAGNLYFQARLFLSGLKNLGPVMAPIEFADFDLENLQISGVNMTEGLGVVQLSATASRRRSMTRDSTLMGRMGTCAAAGMMAAFACELGMKAILMTRRQEFKKTHDLVHLYQELPEDSQSRLEADFAGIDAALRDGRYLFEKWRYFEGRVTKKALEALANTGLLEGLGKAARVIADECAVAGLTYDFRFRKDGKIESERSGMEYSECIRMSLEVGEAPIPWDLVLATACQFAPHEQD